MANLSSVANLIIDGDWIESKDQSDSGIRLIQTGNIGIGKYLDKIDKAKYISEDTFKKLKCTEVIEGDILVSRLPDPIGRACIVPQMNNKCITAVDCTIIRLNKELCDSRYFVHYTCSDTYNLRLSTFFSGSTRTRISRKNLEKTEIPLPPLETQKQIAANLDKVTHIIYLCNNILEKLDLLVKARFVEMFGDPILNQKGFPVYRMDEVVDFQGGSQPDKKYFEYEPTEDNIRLIQIRDYKTDKYITYIPKAMAKRFCTADDIMIGRYGPPIFQILQGIEGSFNVALMKATPKMGTRSLSDIS